MKHQKCWDQTIPSTSFNTLRIKESLPVISRASCLKLIFMKSRLWCALSLFVFPMWASPLCRNSVLWHKPRTAFGQQDNHFIPKERFPYSNMIKINTNTSTISFLYQNKAKKKLKTRHRFITYTTRIIGKYSNSNESPWQYCQKRPRHQFAEITKAHVELHHEYVTSKTQSKETTEQTVVSLTEIQSSLCLIPINMHFSYHSLVK